MDLLTQGLLGSSLALAGSRNNERKKAALIGLIAGLSADLDFFIRSDVDPLLNLEFHRHFTHSIFFIPVAALLLSLLLWLPFRTSLSWRRVFLYSLLGYLLSGILDACTSYGTSLLWPWTDQRFSFNIISIIDPVFTLLLLAGLVLGLYFSKPVLTRVLLAFAVSYLLLGVWQNQHIQSATREHAEQQGHTVERLLVKPTLGNLWLWRTVYQYQGHYYVNALRRNPFTGETRLFPGTRVNRFDPWDHRFDIDPDSVLQRDILRFARFSDRYLALHPENPLLLFDVRYANLPNSQSPLWGILLDPHQPQKHARYQVFRDSSRETRNAFLDMLFSRDPQR